MLDRAKDVMNWVGRDDALVQLLEPLFLYGIGFGLLFFALCFLFKQEVGRKIGLAVIVLCCALVYPYLKFSEQVIEDIDRNPVFAKQGNIPVAQAIKAQYEMRYNTQWYFYALGALALVALLLGSGKVGQWLSGLTLLGSLLVVGFSLYLDMREKKIHYLHMFDTVYVISDGELSADPASPANQGKPGKKKPKATRNNANPSIVQPAP